MNISFILTWRLAVALTVIAPNAIAQSISEARITPQDLVWKKIATGNERAEIAGDDQKSGLYVYRIRFPANSRLPPHSHPDDRVGTVVSGTLYFSYGSTFDESSLKALPQGSSWTEPAGHPHYAWAKEGEVVIEVAGNGPSGMTLVRPK